MYYHITFPKHLFFFLVCYLSACSSQFTVNEPRTPSPPPLSSLESMPLVAETVTAPIMSLPSTPEQVSTSSIDSLSTKLIQRGCPALTETNRLPLWSRGSILFGIGKIVSPNYASPYPLDSKTWAISSNSAMPQLAYETSPEYPARLFISPNGTTFLRFERDETRESESQVVFGDLINGGEVTIGVPANLDTVYESTWLSDERFQYLAAIQPTAGIGEKRIYVTLDAISKQSEIITEELVLPGYAFDPFEIKMGLPSGYAAVDPTGQFVLYTADTETGVEIRLRNRQTGEVIWHQPSEGLPASPSQVDWTADGERVLFVTNVSDADRSYRKIVSLTREGREEELPPQPYPSLEQNTVRYLTLSTSGRYLVYGVWEGAWKGPGYLVDTATSTVGEICRPGVSFLDGFWLPNDQFVYRVLIEDGENLKHSLRVLDIPSWTTQILYESSSGFGVSIFGWTPVEFNSTESMLPSP